MTAKRPVPATITVSAHQQGQYVILDYFVYRAPVLGVMKRCKAHRRVMIRYDEPLSDIQLTALVGRMAAYIQVRSGKPWYVPKHLPWREVGVAQGPVPPSGGEGGEKP